MRQGGIIIPHNNCFRSPEWFLPRTSLRVDGLDSGEKYFQLYATGCAVSRAFRSFPTGLVYYSYHDMDRPRSGILDPTTDSQVLAVHETEEAKADIEKLCRGQLRLFGTELTMSTTRHNGCSHFRPSPDSIGAEGGNRGVAGCTTCRVYASSPPSDLFRSP